MTLLVDVLKTKEMNPTVASLFEEKTPSYALQPVEMSVTSAQKEEKKKRKRNEGDGKDVVSPKKRVMDDESEDSDHSDTEETKTLKRDPTIEKERLKRTVFVGNLSVDVLDKAAFKQFKAIFTPFSEVESALAEPMRRRVAFIQKKLHPAAKTLHAYVVLSNTEATLKAIQTLNATTFLGLHLRVDSCDPESSTEDDETLWELFSSVGKVKNVRVVRDAQIGGLGKGFGFVEFEDRDAVGLALRLDGSMVEGRKIRITRAKKMEEGGKDKVISAKTKLKSVTKGDVKDKAAVAKGPKAVIEGERAVPKSEVKKKKKPRLGRKRTLEWKKGKK